MREGDHSACGCMNLATFFCCRLVLDGQIVCHVFWYVAILPENELSYSAKANLTFSSFFFFHFKVKMAVGQTVALNIGTMSKKQHLESATVSCLQDASIKITVNTSCSAVGGGGHMYVNQPLEWDSHS